MADVTLALRKTGINNDGKMITTTRLNKNTNKKGVEDYKYRDERDFGYATIIAEVTTAGEKRVTSTTTKKKENENTRSSE